MDSASSMTLVTINLENNIIDCASWLTLVTINLEQNSTNVLAS